MKTLETILLNSIDDTIIDCDFSNEALKDTKQLNYVQKFEWAYKKYLIESFNGTTYSLKEWFEGLALHNLPVYYSEIEELGQNPETFYDDLVETLLRVIGLY